jgi:protein SCO1/2
MNSKFLKAFRIAIFFLSLCVLGLTFAQEATPAPTHVRVTGAWVRPADKTSAAYLQIFNDNDFPIQLMGVKTDIASMSEIHETVIKNDVASMQHLPDGIEIPANEQVILAPKGLHIMLMGLKEEIELYDSVDLTLIFDNDLSIAVKAIANDHPIPYELEGDALTEASLNVDPNFYIGKVVNPPIQVQDFVAPVQTGELMNFSDTDGKWRLIFFGYIHCPDFCPLTLVDYKQVKKLLGDEAANVEFLYLSVDAIRDTPEVMLKYIANYDPEFIGFSTDDVTLARIQPDYGFYYERRMDSGSNAVYSVDHSTRSYLVDPEGVLRTSFGYATTPQEMTDALLWFMEQER